MSNGGGEVDEGAARVDAAIERIRRRVAERRAQGEYPPGLEEELDRHYRELVATLATEVETVRRLQEGVGALDHHPTFSVERISTDSRTWAGRAFHRLWAKLSHRQTEGVLVQMREYADTVRRIVDRMAEVVESLALHGHPDTERRVATLADRVSLLEDVADRLDRIESALDEVQRGRVDSSAT